MRKIPLIAIGFAILLVAAGCSDTQIVNTGEGAPNEGSSYGDNAANFGENHDHGDHGHGPDPDAEVTPVSEVTGSWRVARADDDAPVAYFELFGMEDEPDHIGTYIMGLEPARLLDGNRGDIAVSTWDGDQLVVEWNPTAQQSERYTLTATERIDADTMEGQFVAENAPFEFPVKLQRMVFDE